MPLTCISSSCTKALSQIANAARDLKDISGRCLADSDYRVSPDGSHPHDLPPIKLPPVKDITSQLAGLGIPKELLCRIFAVHHQHATKLRDYTEQQIQQAVKQLSALKTSPALLQKAIDGFIELYKRQLEQWECNTIARVRSKVDHTRRRFNNVSMPLPSASRYFSNGSAHRTISLIWSATSKKIPSLHIETRPKWQRDQA
jgi:hypothetical protein